jgi:S-sulfosulfanyl-L-cysteine sulfohydrolase
VRREINGIPCAVIGQTFPYTPIANPRYLVADFRYKLLPVFANMLPADRSYKVAGWAPVSEQAKIAGTAPIWDLVEPWLKALGTVSARRFNVPSLVGAQGNPGFQG